VVKKAHFGGMEGDSTPNDPERPKTKKEVMEEIIAKSKMAKVILLLLISFVVSNH